jgi:probable HAF family extracellular repeat protein
VDASGGLIDLGTLGGDASGATAVNASGQVVGDSRTAHNSATHAFSWTEADGMIDLGTLGGNVSFANAVNDSGQVVGSSGLIGNRTAHAFAWTKLDGMIDLGALADGGFSGANAVNASGQVVGSSEVMGQPGYHAASWMPTGKIVDLGTLGGAVDSEARAVNASGQVVGYSLGLGAAYRAFSWTVAGGTIDLGTIGGGAGVATAVNASGQVVGYSWMADGVSHAFSWTASGGMIALGPLGGDSSAAHAVNAKGQAVGGTSTATGEFHAALWPVHAETLRPIADAYVAAGASASVNFGGAKTLRAKMGIAADNTRRSYLKFDVSPFKDGDRVTLRLHGNASSATGPVKAIVYAVSDTSWDERALTWNTRPALGAVLGAVTVDGRPPQWVYVDVTKFVRSERRAGRNVISLALRSVDHTSAYAEFQSREAGNTGPRLVITP